MKDLASALDGLRQQHLLRSRNISSSPQGVEPIINGKKILSFCSNDYLGLANHPKIIESFSNAAKNFGVGSGASHLITGHHESHHILEEELAAFIGSERALLFSTGYMANLGVINALANRESKIFEDKLNHASLIDAGILSRAQLVRYPHQDMHKLEEVLSQEAAKNKLIVSDGVFSMDGTVTPIAKLQQFAKSYEATLVVDDAHGIGVLGENGKGCTERLLNKNTILVGTLGKAFGTFGAFVAAKHETIEWLIQQARTYVYTTAIPPSIAEATRTSLKLIQTESWRRENLQKLIQQFRSSATELSLPITESTTAIQPLILGSSEKALEVSNKLFALDILVSAIRPPTVPKNQARLRITFSADHTEQHVEKLIAGLKQTLS